MAKKYRIESDSLGQLSIPVNAHYGVQTQRAIENFPVSQLSMPTAFISVLGLIKKTAASVNQQLGLLDMPRATAIIQAAEAVQDGLHDTQFPVDVFQTGSGTSTNMNANEVIASLAAQSSGLDIHPNDHVNLGQSSNDVIPSAIHISATLQLTSGLLPALLHLQNTIEKRAGDLQAHITTGRTHLMDAMPISLAQELSGWAAQVRQGIQRVQNTMPRLCQLAQGGTAVGTGINAHPEFAQCFAETLNKETGLGFSPSSCFFESLSCQDSALELSGQLRVVAVSIMKIANDLRWMNSGPLAGLGEIELQALQPGSSIMPGKVNPVIPESAAMVAAQVMGNDATIAIAAQSGNFQLNVMLPVIAYNLLQSIELLTSTCYLLADKAIATFTVRADVLQKNLAHNPMLATALTPLIGYEKAAEIAKQACHEKRSVLDVAVDLTGMPREQLSRLLAPDSMLNSKRFPGKN